MADFQGTMRIEGDGGPPVPVRARVGDHQLVLETDGVMLGEWPVHRVKAQMDRGGVVLRLGEDHVTLDVSDRIGFVSALAPSDDAPARRKRRKPSLRLVLAVLVAAGLVVAAVLWTQIFGSVGLLAGLVILVVGTVAHSEPRVALRLPLNLHGIHLIVAGLLAVSAGVALILVA